MCISVIAARFTLVISFYLSQEFQDTSFEPKAAPDPDRGQGKERETWSLAPVWGGRSHYDGKSGIRRHASNEAQVAAEQNRPTGCQRLLQVSTSALETLHTWLGKPGGSGTWDVQTGTGFDQNACPLWQWVIQPRVCSDTESRSNSEPWDKGLGTFMCVSLRIF